MSVDQPGGFGSALRANQGIVGGVLIGAGVVITLAGLAVANSARTAALRGRLSGLRDPAATAMRRTWEHTRSAAIAVPRPRRGGNVPAEQATS